MPFRPSRQKFARAAKPSAKMTKLLRDAYEPFDGLLPPEPAEPPDTSPANVPFLTQPDNDEAAGPISINNNAVDDKIPRRPATLKRSDAPMADLVDAPLVKRNKNPNKKRQDISEADFQITLVVFLRRVLPKDALVFHIPNSGHTDWVRLRNKRLGVLSGLPDLCIIWSGKAYWMELKRTKMKATDQQRDVHDMLVDCGCLRPAVVHTVEEAMNALAWWGIPTAGKLSGERF